MADLPSDLTVPLHTVPVGAHAVVTEESPHIISQAVNRLCVVRAGSHGVKVLHTLTGLWAGSYADTPVLHLDGDAPRPLSECEGRDVWGDECGLLTWKPPDEWWKSPRRMWCDTSGTRAATTLVWPIVVPQADPEPRGERPTAQRLTAAHYREALGLVVESVRAHADTRKACGTSAYGNLPTIRDFLIEVTDLAERLAGICEDKATSQRDDGEQR